MARLLPGLLAVLALGAAASAAEDDRGRSAPCTACYAPLDAPGDRPEARERIEAGGVVVRPLLGAGSDGIGVEVFGVIDAPPGRMAALRDVSRPPQRASS